ncbi:MAG: carbohydrate-binding family 9-like protein [Saccharofermentanales bacterium]
MYVTVKETGNFYKCGDKTDCPHYGCWNPILLPAPDFHVPAFFGDFIVSAQEIIP